MNGWEHTLRKSMKLTRLRPTRTGRAWSFNLGTLFGSASGRKVPHQKESKLMDRGDGPFKVLAKVGANAYKLELAGDMVVSATFNIGDLSPYIEDGIDFGDLRANFLKGGEGDADQDPVQDPHPEPEKGLLFSHLQGLFCEAMQLSLEALGRYLLSWKP